MHARTGGKEDSPNDEDPWVSVLEPLCGARDRSPGPSSCHEGIHDLAVQRAQYLFSGRVEMDLRVRSVLVLVRYPRIRYLLAQALRNADVGVWRVERRLRRSANDFGPKSAQHIPVIQTHAKSVLGVWVAFISQANGCSTHAFSLDIFSGMQMMVR